MLPERAIGSIPAANPPQKLPQNVHITKPIHFPVTAKTLFRQNLSRRIPNQALMKTGGTSAFSSQPLFQPKRTGRRRLRASLTVEASLCLPLFLFTAVMLLSPLKMIDQRRMLQNVMEASAKDMSEAAYAEKMLREEGSAFLNQKNISSAAAETLGGSLDGLLEGVNTGFTAARILASLDNRVFQNAYFSKCEVIQNDMIELELHYDLCLPFRLFGIKSIPQSSVVNRRAWTGSSGGRGSGEYGLADGSEDSEALYARDEEGDKVVYVGNTSTVYHTDRHCHYLDNVLTKVSGASVHELRNESGGKYHACESCRPSASGDVYILSSGTAYHSSAECRALASYAREVKLSEVSDLGPCSYCSGGGHHEN